MNIDLYETNKPNTYIALASGQPVPNKVQAVLKHPQRPIKTLDAVRGKPRNTLDPDTVLDDIERDGFAVLGAGIKTTEVV